MAQDNGADVPDASRLAIFIDFDGTLVEIAETPDAVSVPPGLFEDLERAASALGSALAVISGREIADIDRMLSPLTLPVAGGHGTQRRDASGLTHVPESGVRDAVLRIAAYLEDFVSRHPELILESKDASVALHYRQAPELRDAARAAMEAALATETGFHLIDGKMVFEGRPASTDKGEAVKAFMAEAPFAGRVPIFIGDDTTDEDGFRAVQEMGGLGIKIGEGASAANGRLEDVTSVRDFLRRVAGGFEPQDR